MGGGCLDAQSTAHALQLRHTNICNITLQLFIRKCSSSPAAPVAQLVRRRFCGREDPGSIPGAARLPDWRPQLCHWGVGWAPALHRSPEEEQEPSHKWEKHIPCGGRGINKYIKKGQFSAKSSFSNLQDNSNGAMADIAMKHLPSCSVDNWHHFDI